MNTRKHIERLQLETLIGRITQLGYDSPGSIADSERPDFILGMDSRKVGLEITFAVHQEYVRGRKLHQRACPGTCIVTSDLKDRDRRRSNEEILHDLLTIGGPWKDAEEDMQDWREKIGDSLQSKREKLSQPDFQLFDENWLLIFDNPPLPEDSFTYDRAGRHLAALFSAPTNTKRDFHTVFIYSDRYLFRWSGSRLTLNYKHS